MGEPSKYELAAWQDIQQAKGRLLSRVMGNISEHTATGVTKVSNRATSFMASRPRAGSAVRRVRGVASKSAEGVGNTARKAADAVPDGVFNWSGEATRSIRQAVGRASRVGLSPRRVVANHQKRGHHVAALRDLRRLDLEQIDAVRGRGTGWYYPLLAATSGAGAGLAITGGQLVTAASAGAAAAPSAATVLGAFTGDAAFVLGLSSRSVGHVAMLYGYDPEEPTEKIFIMSVLNAGTAMSSGAKTAAMRDISRLTQNLVRGKPWAVLDKSVIAQLTKQFGKAFEVRFTKQSLGKVLPAAGIVVGGAFNWATLESTVDTADLVYRRRFLLEKYPHLAQEETSAFTPRTGQPDVDDANSHEDTDETISVLDELLKAGGPELPAEEE